MSKLDVILSVGKCPSYGDMDYSVSLRSLSREELQEVIVSTHYALKVLTDNWHRNNQPPQAQVTEL